MESAFVRNELIILKLGGAFRDMSRLKPHYFGNRGGSVGCSGHMNRGIECESTNEQAL